MLRMEVQHAWQLKQPVEAMASISERGMLVVSPEWFLLTCMNEDHLLPIALHLSPIWFQYYQLTTLDPTRIGRHRYYAISLNLARLSAILRPANHTSATVRYYGMETRQEENPNLQPWISMAYIHHTFKFSLGSIPFTRLLQQSIRFQTPISIDVTSLRIRLSTAGETIIFHKTSACVIKKIPEGRRFRIVLSMYSASYSLSVSQMSPYIEFRFQDPHCNSNPDLLLVIKWRGGGQFKIQVPSMSVFRPQVQSLAL